MTTYISSIILGLSPSTVKKQPQLSRIKVNTLAMLIFLPVLIWGISGYLIALNFMELDTQAAALTGMVCAGMIYTIDRSFITAYGGKHLWLMNLMRIFFALLSAILGGLALDMVIFEKDIAAYQKEKGQTNFEEYKSEYKAKYAAVTESYDSGLADALLYFRTKEAEYIQEVDGNGGSGKTGKGPVALAKEEVRNAAKIAYWDATKKREDYLAKLEEDAAHHASEKVEKPQGALLTKINDFHHFLSEHRVARYAYILFMVLVVFIESALILYKMSARETVLEELFAAEEWAAAERLRALERQRTELERARQELGDQRVNGIREVSM